MPLVYPTQNTVLYRFVVDSTHFWLGLNWLRVSRVFNVGWMGGLLAAHAIIPSRQQCFSTFHHPPSKSRKKIVLSLGSYFILKFWSNSDIFLNQTSIFDRYAIGCGLQEWIKKHTCLKETKIHASLYLLIWDFLLSQINIWTTTTCSNVWVVLLKPSWYEFLIGFLIWTPASKYLHLTTFSNICVILSMFLYL
jgi:hypothetical protein